MKTTLLLILCAANAGAVSIDQTRSAVLVMGGATFGHTVSYGDEENTTARQFDSRVSGSAALVRPPGGEIPTTEPIWLSQSTSILRSSAAVDSITGAASATGLIRGYDNPDWRPSARAEAHSTFDVTFSLDEAVEYSLAGYTQETTDTARTRLTLSLIGGDALVDIFDATRSLVFSRYSDFDITGTLLPGTYRLLASASITGFGVRERVEMHSTLNFALNFTAPVAEVPDGISTAWLLAPLALIFLRRR